MAQFTMVDCSRGAPMGRSTYGTPEDCPDKSINLFKVNFIDGDYDDGGAYWGGGLGAGYLYCARYGNIYRNFTRANSREHAARIMRIYDGKLRIRVTP